MLLDKEKGIMPLEPIYSLDTLRSFILKSQHQYSDNHAVIYFFGGEPTLCYDRIIQLIDFIGNQIEDVSVEYVLHTNGLLLKDISVKIASSLAVLMHSINYEKIPRYTLKDSYFSQIIEGLRSFRQKSKAAVIGRLTITEKTSLYTEVLQISHFYDYIYWQIENRDQFINYKSFYTTYTFEIELLFDYWLMHFNQGILLNYVPFIAVLKFMLDHDRDDTTFSCGYGRGMIYLQTDGSCYACSDNVDSNIHKIGSIDSGVTMPEPSLLDLKCKGCKYRSLCMGRCGRMHKEYDQNHISQYCALNHYMFDLFLSNKAFCGTKYSTDDFFEKDIYNRKYKLFSIE